MKEKAKGVKAKGVKVVEVALSKSTLQMDDFSQISGKTVNYIDQLLELLQDDPQDIETIFTLLNCLQSSTLSVLSSFPVIFTPRFHS